MQAEAAMRVGDLRFGEDEIAEIEGRSADNPLLRRARVPKWGRLHEAFILIRQHFRFARAALGPAVEHCFGGRAKARLSLGAVCA